MSGACIEIADACKEVGDASLARMLLIRNFELALLRLFEQGEVAGTTHTCLGQEYIPVAVSDQLRGDDTVFSNHRGHGHYLARYDDPAGLLAEILGREGALCQGVGGSQHLHRPGFLSTGVQGENIQLGLGSALHHRRAGRGDLAVVYIGDGTWGQGAVYESLNIAALWQLPLVVIVENNGIAQSTPIEHNLAGTIEGRVRGFGVDYLMIDSSQLPDISVCLLPAMARARTEPRPLVVEFATLRLGPHSKGDDTRSAELLDELQQRDWYVRYRTAFPDQTRGVEEGVQRRIQALVSEVRSRRPSQWIDR